MAGDCIAGSAANADAGGGCATAMVPRQSAGTRQRQELFIGTTLDDLG
jgi:hypothetical protein